MTTSEQELDTLRKELAAEAPTNVPMTTIAEMSTLAEQIAALREREDQAAQAKKKITAELESVERRMLDLLLENNLPNFRAPAGLCSITTRTSVKTPKTPEQKAALYAYLKEIGKYEDMISVNSQTLNSFFKEAHELARERGEENFTIPGLTEVTETPNLSFKRPK